MVKEPRSYTLPVMLLVGKGEEEPDRPSEI